MGTLFLTKEARTFNGQRQFSSVQSLSHVWLFETPWTAACQASLSITPGVYPNPCPLSRWCQTDGETTEKVTDFIFSGSKITADGDCSHEIKRRLLLGRKVMTNPDSILKSRDITLSTGSSSQSYGFSSSHVWMWEFDHKESWKLKDWCFWTVVLETTLESPLDCKEVVHSEGDQPWDFFGRNDAKSWNSSTLATSCEELTHWKRLWCWEGLGAGGEGDDRGWDGWMASLSQWTWVWVNSRSWWWTGRPGVLRFMGSQIVGHDWATELNWTELITSKFLTCKLETGRRIFL